jgi:hypothetical protein
MMKRKRLLNFIPKGNPVNKYILATPLCPFIVDEVSNIIVGYNYNDEDYLYVYDMGL